MISSIRRGNPEHVCHAAAPCARSRAWCTWWTPRRVQRPPVRVRCPVAFSWSAAGAAVLDDGRERFLLALVPCPATVDELEPVGRHPAGGAALLLEYLKRR